MKILVPVKRVIDPYVKIRVKLDQSSVENERVKMAMNPFDEIALEAAIQLKEQGVAKEVIAVSIGETAVEETLRHALALGADQALFVKANQIFCPLNLAKILKAIVLQQEVDCVLMGKQSIDGDNNQTPQRLAGLLDWPQATYASKIKLQGQQLEVEREVDEGIETIIVDLPAVISVDLRLNTPRYASLPNIMQARRKPIETLDVEALALDLSERYKVLSVSPPPAKAPGVVLNSVDELVEKLRHQDKLI